MPRTKKPTPNPAAQPPVNGPAPEVLTLAEAAAYLRLPEKEVIGAFSTQGLPGRLIGGDWRFLKAAIQQGIQRAAGGPNAALLAFAGAWKDDPKTPAGPHSAPPRSAGFPAGWRL